MFDPRHKKLAEVLIKHSTKVKPGDKVLVECSDTPYEFISVLVQEIYAAGGIPVLEYKHQAVNRKLIMLGNEETFKVNADAELYRMKMMDCYIAVRGIFNSKEISDIPSDKMSLWEKNWLKPVHLKQRVEQTRWVILKYPSPQMAQMAKMSHEAFEDFFYRVCCDVDWKKANEAMVPAKAFLEKSDKVHIKGPGTDLQFSIKGIPWKPCGGEFNIPDLEIFSAPVRTSVNGKISYNSPSTYRGFTFENVVLEFKDGKIVNATANDTKRINSIFDSDEGARYVGEFALGFHPYVLDPMDDILFDEKIAGSFHFTPGQAYEFEADNGNRSQIHWDLVCIQRPEYGGGEIWIDGVLIRKDGIFVHEAFLKMNPENLTK
jgi:aminopeptidase